MMEDFSTIYEREVQRLRERLQELSLGELETACDVCGHGVSRQHLWNIRQGRHKPKAETLAAIWAGIRQLEEAERESGNGC